MSVGIRVRASYLLAPLLIAASLVGCGEEEEREFTVMVTTDQGALAGDGSEVAIVRATVLDQHDRPPPLGGEILLQVQGPGVVGRTGGASGYAFIDVTGAAGFDVACSDAGTLQLMAAYEGAFGFLPWHIECGTLPGDWQIFMDIESSRPVPGQVLAVTIDVVDGSGDPVPSGTRITLEVTSGDFLWFPTLVQILTVQTHGPSGRIVQSLVTPDSSGTALVCARFSDERLGDEMCRGVVVAW